VRADLSRKDPGELFDRSLGGRVGAVRGEHEAGRGRREVDDTAAVRQSPRCFAQGVKDPLTLMLRIRSSSSSVIARDTGRSFYGNCAVTRPHAARGERSPRDPGGIIPWSAWRWRCR